MLVDFKEVESLVAAGYEALVEAIHCSLDEFDCVEIELQIRISSTELVNWLTEGD